MSAGDEVPEPVNMVCKDSKGTISLQGNTVMSMEELMICFFHESFQSDRVYIISPWISDFQFRSKFVHQPYVSGYSVIDVLRGLMNKGIAVKVLTRCADDAIDISLIKTVTGLDSKERQEVPSDIRNLLKRKIEDLIGKLTSSKALATEFNEGIRFDLGDKDDTRLRGRLHSKLYINHRTVIMGSANFTLSGISDGGNWECLVRFSRDEKRDLYDYAVGVAEHYLRISRSFDECERRVIKIVNNASNLIGERIYSIEDLIDYLNRVKEGLDRSVP